MMLKTHETTNCIILLITLCPLIDYEHRKVIKDTFGESSAHKHTLFN